MADKITPQNEDYSRWYLDVIREAELSEASPVRGSMVIFSMAAVSLMTKHNSVPS